MIFSLDFLKQHLRDPPEEEDIYLTSLGVAAEQAFNHYTGRILYAREADLTDAPENALVVTEEIELGAAVLVAWLYENREGSVNGHQLPLPTRLLWNPHRWLAV
ncbi:head-tail connector protein [Microbulbifer sp. 2205BS26-8]|uniref:head-tail connector protein n=1 Tax=Microbulbifer sp. 2205BS26-8 TaxID=3064386 RepID=UPI00273D10C7|nr:head-tail connector protein [Microbulbifer sp. 2205BS26-8]MDP5211066.1 head-tail connector protein [Microbulbifer sp. 2205BS26-8]